MCGTLDFFSGQWGIKIRGRAHDADRFWSVLKWSDLVQSWLVLDGPELHLKVCTIKTKECGNTPWNQSWWDRLPIVTQSASIGVQSWHNRRPIVAELETQFDGCPCASVYATTSIHLKMNDCHIKQSSLIILKYTASFSKYAGYVKHFWHRIGTVPYGIC